MRWVLADFETASACNLKIAGAFRYAEDPTTDILCLGYSVNGEKARLWIPGTRDDLLMELACDPETIWIAHNAAFEKAIWRAIMVQVYGFPNIVNSRWHDTLAMCAMRAIPQELDMAARVLDLSEQKDTAGSKFTKAMSKPNKRGYYDRSDTALTRVYTYCLQDVPTEVELHRKLGALPLGERNVWLLDQRINERGIRLDLPFIRAAQRVVDGATVPLLAEFGRLTGDLRPSQGAQFKSWIRSNGFEVPDLKKETLVRLLGDPEAEDDSLAGDEVNWSEPVEMPENVHRALSIRQLVESASIKKLARMQACVCADGRARGLLQYHGAGPGRWAGRLLQPHNFPRGTIKLGKKPPDPQLVVDAIMTGDHEYVGMLLGPAVEVVVGALRHAIIASDDRELVVGDFAGIEARVVLALAGNTSLVGLMAAGKDVYLDMAEDIYKVPKGTYNKDANGAERQIGKNTILGCGFQMGWKKFKMRYCPEQSDEFAQNVVKTYRTVSAPEVPLLWRALEDAARETVWTGRPHEAYGVEYRMEGEWLSARLPSGRKLWYFHPAPTRKEMPWSTEEDPDVRPAWRYWARKLGRWIPIDAFGGLLTENVVQALARDLLVAAMFRCERNGVPIVLTVHDEIVGEPKRADADKKALQQMMEEHTDWSRALNVPLLAECWQGPRYKK